MKENKLAELSMDFSVDTNILENNLVHFGKRLCCYISILVALCLWWLIIITFLLFYLNSASFCRSFVKKCDKSHINSPTPHS